MALTTTAKTGITYRTSWEPSKWGMDKLDFWDDFSDDGRLEDRPRTEDAPQGSLSVSVTIPPRGTKEVVFFLTWHFPNRPTWTPSKKSTKDKLDPSDRVGNYYTTQYADAWEVAQRAAKSLKKLEKDTVTFVKAFCESDLPQPVKEAALFNISTLRSQTCFRTPDGRFFGWEGCNDRAGSCHGTATHVWSYEQATGFLFGELAKTMRDVEFAHATSDEGLISFRVNLPLARAKEWCYAATDGQMACLMRLYRDWQLSGDDQMLKTLWPKARKAMEFCWLPGSWDADRDGVMEGCQHNTMDVEYYGPSGQLQSWYLAALRACEEMATYLGEDEFAATCRDLFQRGSAWTDEHLFNGEYYEHDIRPPTDESQLSAGTCPKMGATDIRELDFQLGAGCMVDQMVGQYVAHLLGLGYVLKPSHVRRALKSVFKYNFRKNLFDHFNNMRSFFLNDEQGLLMATYPRGGRPKRPIPYFAEAMTGFEYTAAVGMIQEGLTDKGLQCIAAIRDRFDGRKRSPFNESEAGYHYARAMTSWAAVLALTGFHYSGVDKTLEFAAPNGRKAETVFWSNGYAWGTCRRKRVAGGVEASITVLHGTLKIKQFTITGVGTVTCRAMRTITAGRTAKFVVKAS